MATRTNTKKKKTLTTYRVSRILVSLTLLGSLWRTALFLATLIAVAAVDMFSRAGVDGVDMTYAAYTLMAVMVYTAAFVIYDGVYGYVVRRYGEMELADKIILFGMESILLLTIIISSAFYTNMFVPTVITNDMLNLIVWLLIISALLLPLRAFIGVSYVVMTRKRPQ